MLLAAASTSSGTDSAVRNVGGGRASGSSLWLEGGGGGTGCGVGEGGGDRATGLLAAAAAAADFSAVVSEVDGYPLLQLADEGDDHEEAGGVLAQVLSGGQVLLLPGEVVHTEPRYVSDILPDARFELGLLGNPGDDVHPSCLLAVPGLALKIMLTLDEGPNIKPSLLIDLPDGTVLVALSSLQLSLGEVLVEDDGSPSGPAVLVAPPLGLEAVQVPGLRAPHQERTLVEDGSHELLHAAVGESGVLRSYQVQVEPVRNLNMRAELERIVLVFIGNVDQSQITWQSCTRSGRLP